MYIQSSSFRFVREDSILWDSREREHKLERAATSIMGCPGTKFDCDQSIMKQFIIYEGLDTLITVSILKRRK